MLPQDPFKDSAQLCCPRNRTGSKLWLKRDRIQYLLFSCSTGLRETNPIPSYRLLLHPHWLRWAKPRLHPLPVSICLLPIHVCGGKGRESWLYSNLFSLCTQNGIVGMLCSGVRVWYMLHYLSVQAHKTVQNWIQNKNLIFTWKCHHRKLLNRMITLKGCIFKGATTQPPFLHVHLYIPLPTHIFSVIITCRWYCLQSNSQAPLHCSSSVWKWYMQMGWCRKAYKCKSHLFLCP